MIDQIKNKNNTREEVKEIEAFEKQIYSIGKQNSEITRRSAITESDLEGNETENEQIKDHLD
jgi:hypothetical protein